MRISDWSSDVCSSDRHHIIGLRDADLDLVGLHRLDMLAVALHHRHRQSRQAQVEIGHGGRIDDAQPYPLDRREESCPVERKRVGSGKGVSVSVTLGGRRNIKTKNIEKQTEKDQ